MKDDILDVERSKNIETRTGRKVFEYLGKEILMRQGNKAAAAVHDVLAMGERKIHVNAFIAYLGKKGKFQNGEASGAFLEPGIDRRDTVLDGHGLFLKRNGDIFKIEEYDETNGKQYPDSSFLYHTGKIFQSVSRHHSHREDDKNSITSRYPDPPESGDKR
jgi:hypothetical protein